jgi:uncharacterized protein
MEIQLEEADKKGTFYIEEDGERLAEMVYTLPVPGKMIIEHTFVDDELRGQNIGFRLVQSGADYARKNGLKVIPTCVFAKAVFDRKPELQDVLERE